MFLRGIVFWGLVITWAVIAFVLWRMDTPLARVLKLRAFTALGVILILGAFLFQPWVRLDFIGYIDPTPEFLRSLGSGRVIQRVLGELDDSLLPHVFGVLERMTHLNGWQMELVPTYNLWVRLATLFPLLPALVAAFGVPVSMLFRGGLLSKALGYSMIGLSLIGLPVLFMALPAIDALGVQDDFRWMLLATLLGSRLGSGPWFTLLGLGMLCIGGVVEIKDAPAADDGFDKGDMAWR